MADSVSPSIHLDIDSTITKDELISSLCDPIELHQTPYCCSIIPLTGRLKKPSTILPADKKTLKVVQSSKNLNKQNSCQLYKTPIPKDDNT